MDTPVTDLAAPILTGDQTLDDSTRADLWDAFHTKSASELVQHLQPLLLPEDTKKKLYDAKVQSTPVDPVGKTKDIMSQMANIDPKVLELAESHPNVLKTLVAAATPKEAKETKTTTPGAKTGAKSEPTAEKTPLEQPPRPDGQPHLSPIPANHYRVKASDGGIHDIPAENIEKARQLDPTLHVLNP